MKGFAFIGSASVPGKDAVIHAFEISGSKWRPMQIIPASSPAHLEAHPTLPVLYAVHDVALWGSLPRGAVSAYSIAEDGHLALLNTQPLSLSATNPRHAAVTFDGRHLLVAAERGGIYNLLPMAADGRLEPPAAIRKEIGLVEGSVSKPAAPHQVVMHPSGSTALTVDSGQETITILDFDKDYIHVRHRIRAHAGAGASQIVLSPVGDMIYAQHATNGSISAHRLTGAVVRSPSLTCMPVRPGPARLAMHPSGRFLLTANDASLTTLTIEPSTGELSATAAIPLPDGARLVAFAPEGTLIFCVDRSGQILQIPFDPASGALSTPHPVGRVEAAISMHLRLA